MIDVPERVSVKLERELHRIATANDPTHARGVRKTQLGVQAALAAIDARVEEIVVAAGFSLRPAPESPPRAGLTASLPPVHDVDRTIAVVFGRVVEPLVGAQRHALRAHVIAMLWEELPTIAAAHVSPLVTADQRAAHHQALKADAAADIQREFLQNVGPGGYPPYPPSADERTVSEALAEYRKVLHRLFSSPDTAENVYSQLRQRVSEMALSAAVMFLADEPSVLGWIDALAPGAQRRRVEAPRPVRASREVPGFPAADPTSRRYR